MSTSQYLHYVALQNKPLLISHQTEFRVHAEKCRWRPPGRLCSLVDWSETDVSCAWYERPASPEAGHTEEPSSSSSCSGGGPCLCYYRWVVDIWSVEGFAQIKSYKYTQLIPLRQATSSLVKDLLYSQAILEKAVGYITSYMFKGL